MSRASDASSTSDDAADSGHVGNSVVYIRALPQTVPALRTGVCSQSCMISEA
jgi:hypothetical protein